MAKLTLASITSGYASVDVLNSNANLIEAALENTLSLDGTSPNSMQADLDLNNNDILNGGTIACTDLTVNGSSVAASATAAASSAAAASVSAAAALVSETNAETAETNAELAASLITDWTFEGAWVTATVYAVNNIVTYDGETYICLEAHTAGVFATDYGALKWAKLAAKGSSGAGTGDLVSTNNLSDVTNAATALANLGGQPVDADLTAIAALTTTAYGRALLTVATEAALKALINLEIGTDVQAYDATLTAFAGGLTAANKIPYATALNTLGELDFKDEDDMVSNSATAIPSQQSVKAYVDSAGSGTMVLIETWTATASASKIFDLQEDVYCQWIFQVDGVIPATDDEYLRMFPGYAAGTSFDTTNFTGDALGSVTTANDWAVIGSVDPGGGVGTAAGEHAHATITVGGIGSTLVGGLSYESKASWVDSGATQEGAIIRGVYTGTSERVWDSVKFAWSSGNFEATGTIKMFGLKRAG